MSYIILDWKTFCMQELNINLEIYYSQIAYPINIQDSEVQANVILQSNKKSNLMMYSPYLGW